MGRPGWRPLSAGVAQVTRANYIQRWTDGHVCSDGDVQAEAPLVDLPP
jgi:hypothetical protein